MMGVGIRQSYFISPDIDLKKLAAAPVPLVPVKTDGAYFLEQIRAHFTHSGLVVKEEAFAYCNECLDFVAGRHNKTADAYLKTHHPLLILALAY